jgi:hypothetical protein
MNRPLCIDLFCGLGGWTEGFLAEGWDVIGFDIEQHVYGEERYPAQLVLQDVRTIHGKQFKNADMIVASSPCQAYSYMAMPWSKAKAIAAALRGRGEFPEGYKGYRTIDELNDLFEQPKRIQREAIEAAGGRFIPLIQENVRGAIPWVGRSQWHYGSFHLWGDVPALMPTTLARKLGGGASWYPPTDPRHQPGLDFTRLAAMHANGIKAGDRNKARKNGGVGKKNGGDWFSAGEGMSAQRKASSKSKARKAASAKIAKIPFPLASHIARVYYPMRSEAA